MKGDTGNPKTKTGPIAGPANGAAAGNPAAAPGKKPGMASGGIPGPASEPSPASGTPGSASGTPKAVKPLAASKPAPKADARGAETRKPVKDAFRDKDLFPEDDEEAEEAGVEEDSDPEPEDELLLDPTLAVADTSERIILVVDEEGQRRNETVAIISQILPNAVIEVANDPEEALSMMEEGDFDTFVVNFLMPGYSSSPFVKAVANHPEHPLLIGFAADKMSDAVDPKKGLKIIPLKRLFDLDTSTGAEAAEGGEAAEE